ncbi:MAG: hypothetical protein K8R36_19980 [Planctomycetales bacterium]|nr:hypothetical protein [Planctomycetales bacterium]
MEERDNELTVEEMIELELCVVNAVIDSLSEPSPRFFHARESLVSLLNQLRSNQIQAEYAEVELEQIDSQIFGSEATDEDDLPA